MARKDLEQGFEEAYGVERGGMEVPRRVRRPMPKGKSGRKPQSLAGTRGLQATPLRFAGDEDKAPPSSFDRPDGHLLDRQTTHMAETGFQALKLFGK